MKGYIYTMFPKADPGRGWNLTDPIFGKVPTLGSCVPNVRRVVQPGDHIFAISGRTSGVKQYVVGGFKVAEKVSQLAAFGRFPELRQHKVDDGTLRGNIIVTADGKQNPVDYHSNFDRRLDNYVIGTDPRVVEGDSRIQRAREETLDRLQEVFGKKGKTVFEVIGRWRKLNEGQIENLVGWLDSIRGA